MSAQTNKGRPPTNANAKFSKLLAKHLRAGTRPELLGGEPWTHASFSAALSKIKGHRISDRTVSYWCEGRSLPREIEPILVALFGPDRNQQAELRAELREAFAASKDKMTISRARPDLNWPRWIIDSDRLTQEKLAVATDLEYAKAEPQTQRQAAIREASASLAEAASRLSNSNLWSRLYTFSGALAEITAAAPEILIRNLGNIYAFSIRIAGFLEINRTLQKNSQEIEAPLDAYLYGLLIEVVELTAPWLHGFPSVIAQLSPPHALEIPSEAARLVAELGRIALGQNAIKPSDAAQMELLSESIIATSIHNRRTHVEAAGVARNLILALSQVATSERSIVVSRGNNHLGLSDRALQVLVISESIIDVFISDFPIDLREAIRSAIDRARRAGSPETHSGLLAKPTGVLSHVEMRARAMILDGMAPPEEWRRQIRVLDFSDTKLVDLKPLANLSTLTSLNLSGTPAVDMSVVSKLINLQSLYLTGTNITDISFLSHLTRLEAIDLRNTGVTDISALLPLRTLRSLVLGGSVFSDTSILSGLTTLEFLELSSTQIKEIDSISSLHKLRHLDLSDTDVTNISPLQSLESLEVLNLMDTPVKDISSLKNITSLQKLDLGYSQVEDISALASLVSLRTLVLARYSPIDEQSANLAYSGITGLSKGVRSLAALAKLTNLEQLDISGTIIEDISSLSTLSKLKLLDIRNTRVKDVSSLSDIPSLEILWKDK